METNVSINWLAIILLFLPIPLMIWSLRRSGAVAVHRSPRPRNRLVRAFSGLVAIGLAATVGIDTWRCVQRAYAPLSGDTPLTLSMPTREVGEGGTRFLMDFIITERMGKGWAPIHVESVDYRRAGPGPQLTTRQVHFGPYTADLWFNFLNQSVAPTTVGVTFVSHRNSAASAQGITAGLLHHLAIRVPDEPIFSVRRGMTREFVVFVRVRAVAADDPLQAVPFDEAVEPDREAIAGVHASWPRLYEPGRGVDRTAPAGIVLGVASGFASVFLLAAAALGAQCFRWRSFALAGWVLGIVTFSIVLDRAVLATHAGYLSDPASTPEQRRVAAELIGDTFFFQKTARAIAADHPVDGSPDPSR